MNSKLIIERFREWREQQRHIALVTVFETVGSTYSKAGHRILIAGSGEYQGLVSGGCLEGDLAERAGEVLVTGRAQVVTYDLRDEADELFGLGVGCDGLLRLLVQPMPVAGSYEPFDAIAAAMLGRDEAAVATMIACSDAGVEPGATLVLAGREIRHCGVPDALIGQLRTGCEEALATGRARLAALGPGLEVLFAPLARVPRLLVLGAGIDAAPLVTMANALGWRVRVADHRPAYLERKAFEVAESVSLVSPAALAATIAVDDFDAVVVMSHHLATDEAYLRALVTADCRYVGVLGPRARRSKLLVAIGAADGAFAARLRGPVGLDIGADSPETIALSILAEIQLVLGKRQTSPVAVA